MTDQDPAWKHDPTGRHDHRYWDGSTWTDNVADAGVAGSDPYPGSPGEEPTLVDAPVASDPTSQWPIDPTAPAAPVPPDPAATGSTDDGARKRLLVGGAILAAVAIAVIAFIALADDDGGGSADLRADLAARLREESDDALTESEARCVANHVADEIGDERLAEIDLSAEDPPDDVADALGPALEDCDVAPGAFGDDDPVLPNPPGLPGVPNLPGDIEETLADTYENLLGLTRRQAECLARRLAEAIEGGIVDPQSAATDFFDYLADCDISLEDLTGPGSGR